MDSIASYEDYAKRALELGHKVLTSVEHGWQSNYYVPYGVAQKYGLKFVFGTEAYWVKDRFNKESKAHHIIIMAKNENGRQAINDVLSEANITGYYYKPRLDLSLIMSLPPEDVFITTACVAFWGYEDIEEIIVRFASHFKENFMLEIQYHNTPAQIQLNQQIKLLSDKYGIQLIAGMDSHYIYPSEAVLRDEALISKGIRYEDEDGWYLDYPSDEECFARFKVQNVFTDEEIQQAMNNTDVLLTFDDLYFSKEIKLPVLPKYKTKTLDERKKIYSKLITKQFKEYMATIAPWEYERYFQGVKEEVAVYKDTGMVDYPLINYEVIKRGIELGGVITDTGRGSAVGFFTNTLCGFSKVDRFQSAIHIYPERFMSTSRILETHSLPDIDQNVADTAPFEQAQKEILGEDHAYPMIAFGTLKKKSAFKLYARAKDIPAKLANEISQQIDKYDTDYKYADEDDKKDINIYDYVDSRYHDHIKQSEEYWGIISDRKKAPSAHLLYGGSIRKEIGLIKCKSESTKKEAITCVIDGAVAEEYKFLKNDLLVVNVVDLIDRVFKRINIPHFDVPTLLANVKDNQAVWDIYARGLTIGVNQCEKESTRQKAMRYKPRNVSELAAFIAGIRPGFKSMYPIFESRQPFSYGIATLDNLLITDELPVPFMIFQEQVMKVLNFAGFPMDECYGLIKAISKKKIEKVKAIKDQFIRQFAQKIQTEENLSLQTAEALSEKVWQIIDDNSNYSFNSSHAYCMALDSLYCAWLKATYPYEFYEVLLQFYSNKGDKDKVAQLKQEMYLGFGIKEGRFVFGADNRTFKADPEHGVINSSILSLKKMSQGCANKLYELSQNKTYDEFYTLYKDIKNMKGIKADQIDVLINIGYFDKFAYPDKISTFVEAIEKLSGRSQFLKDELPAEYSQIIIKHCKRETAKQYRDFDFESAIKEIWDILPSTKPKTAERIKTEFKYFGYIHTVLPKLTDEFYFVLGTETKYSKTNLTLHRLCDGQTINIKIQNKLMEEYGDIVTGQIIKVLEQKEEKRWGKNADGEWIRLEETELLIKKYALAS